jgi:hypothetical protein
VITTAFSSPWREKAVVIMAKGGEAPFSDAAAPPMTST